jgi:4-hydroxythreonine-4-phosphate dehydrogenase
MIGVTIGDPSGIGPEIVLKALSSPSLRGCGKQPLLLIGNMKILEELNHKISTRYSQDYSFLSRVNPAPIYTSHKRINHTTKIDKNLVENRGGVNLVESGGSFSYKFGKPQKQCGISSALQLHLASHLLKTGKIKGVVTAPVSKTALVMAGFPFAGQTEYFASEFGIEKFAMLGWSEQVKIVLVTIHTPLKQVPKIITTKNVLDKIVLLNNYLKHYEKIKRPRIGVFALNPHAFEFTCGAEDKILKAINQARKLGIKADGPIPADSALFFALRSSLLPRHDAYVAMYHDQGMLPVKLLSKGSGVTITRCCI